MALSFDCGNLATAVDPSGSKQFHCLDFPSSQASHQTSIEIINAPPHESLRQINCRQTICSTQMEGSRVKSVGDTCLNCGN
jgi:hypothetical protein